MNLNKTVTLLFKILAIIMACEGLIMFVLSTIPPLPVWLESMLDSGFLALMSTYPLWAFVIKPIIKDTEIEQVKNFRSTLDKNLSVLFENMLEGVVVQNSKGEITFFNQAALDILGLSEDQILGRTSFDPRWKSIKENGQEFPGHEHPAIQALTTGQKKIQQVMGIHKPDGELRWISINAAPIFDTGSNSASRVVCTFQDITDSKNLITDLENHKARMAIASKTRNLGIWDWDLQNNSLFWDDSMYSIYGLEKKSTNDLFERFLKILLPEDAIKVDQDLKKAFASQKDYFGEFKIRKPNGEIRTIKSASHATYDTQGNPLRLTGINWDVTEEKEQELRLIHASKMSSLGEMSAGIAHEINNPLSIISGKSRQILRAINTSEIDRTEIISHLDIIQKTTNRIATIIKGLRTFARDNPMDPFQQVRAQTLIEETLSFCHSKFTSHQVVITVHNQVPDLTFECRPTQISQVLLNLLNNAFDAIQTQPEKWIQLDVRTQNNYIEFIVTDCGSGIPESVHQKIMQPFFTTKGAGHGTGLGLSIASGLIRAHQGELILDTKNKNTSFICRVPIHQVAETRAA